MTFIASVIAKDGIAIVADSLVSTKERRIEADDWLKFIAKKKDESKNKDYAISEDEIGALFKTSTKYAKNYERKLFVYDDYTVITTAGYAYIHNKSIRKIVNEIKQVTQKKLRSYKPQKIETKVENFVAQLVVHAKLHIEENGVIGRTVFIISSFNPKTSKSSVFKVQVNPMVKETLESDDEAVKKLVTHEASNGMITYDGQYKIVDRILWGSFSRVLNAVPKLIHLFKKRLIDDGIIEPEAIPDDYLTFFTNFTDKETEGVYKEALSDVEIFKLSHLSLQEAVDLAYTLLKVESDFQKYTVDIPTVGGDVKLVTISDDKVTHVMGKGVVNPRSH